MRNMRKGTEIKSTIETIKMLRANKKAKLFVMLSKMIAVPRRKRKGVNLRKIDLYSKPNSVVVIPGKVLGDGELKHPVDIVALSATEEAAKKIKSAGAKMHDFKWLTERGPKDVILLV